MDGERMPSVTHIAGRILHTLRIAYPPRAISLSAAALLVMAACQSTATPVPTSTAGTATTSPTTAIASPTPVSSPPIAPSPVATTSSPGATASPTQGNGDWPTYHRDLIRSGVDSALSSFSQVTEAWRSGALDGDIYAEPLVAGGRVYIATENNTVYSFDLATGRQIWQAHLGEPVPRTMLPCGDIPITGITGTPVVDVAGGLLYAVTFVLPGRHELVALDLAAGAVRFRVPIDPQGANPLTHQQRAALTLSGNMVYVGFGGLYGDCGDYHGWVIAADAKSGATRYSYQVPTQREGAIWAPGGPSIDGSGNLFVATGNGSSTDPSRFDYGDAVLRLSPDLRLLDWFAPSDWAALNRSDADLGSISPALLDNGLIFQSGKAGVGYLLQQNQLGHIGGEVYQEKVCAGAYGGTAFQSPLLYVPCTDGLVALRVSAGNFSVAWKASGFFAGPPIVAGGAVWTIARDGTLYSIDPGDGHVRSKSALGSVAHFVTPAASGSYLLLPAARELVAERLE